MIYVTKITAFSLFGLSMLAQAQLSIIGDLPTVICDEDAECDYHCCGVEEQFKKEGVCVKIEDFDRCKDRKWRYNISLLCYLIVFIVFFLTCGLCKRKQLFEERQQLERLKIEKQHEENVKQKRREARAAAVIKAKDESLAKSPSNAPLFGGRNYSEASEGDVNSGLLTRTGQFAGGTSTTD